MVKVINEGVLNIITLSFKEKKTKNYFPLKIIMFFFTAINYYLIFFFFLIFFNRRKLNPTEVKTILE